jgi:secondary thiamine-phosphate synthase enzyme
MLRAPSVVAVAAGIVRHAQITVTTTSATEFVDLTDRVAAIVAASGISDGVATVHCRHTTAGLLINEHEPLLLQDLRALFDQIAPRWVMYAHDDFHRRGLDAAAAERINGHAHCRAALLRASECLPIVAGALELGRWQRVFFVDFDGGQDREVWLTLLGQP